jgi:uncharacterized protein YabE (DUF348 family)
MRFFDSKITKWTAILVFLIFLIWLVWFFFFRNNTELNFDNSSKNIILNDNKLKFNLTTKTDTVEELLKEKNVILAEHDQITPDLKNKIFSGTEIEIKRAMKIKILADGKIIENYTTAKNISVALFENGITLSRLDKTSPEKWKTVQDNLNIIVTRINVEEKTIQEDIDFKIIVKEDKKLGWREKKIEISGTKGMRETVYKITYKNGKEISRIKLSQKIVKEPKPQTEIQGTYMKLGKASKGQGTWYAYKGGMFAASTSIPKGNYAKVTSLASGKTIIVQINDYGPQGKGRIIDLDSVAFKKLASLGAGVIGVKVEEILN